MNRCVDRAKTGSTLVLLLQAACRASRNFVPSIRVRSSPRLRRRFRLCCRPLGHPPVVRPGYGFMRRGDIVAVIDAMTGANYMFLRHPPADRAVLTFVGVLDVMLTVRGRPRTFGYYLRGRTGDARCGPRVGVGRCGAPRSPPTCRVGPLGPSR
jgi:hypothetical protein